MSDFEKKLLETVEPLADAIVDVEKKIETVSK